MQVGHIPCGHQEVNGSTHRPPNLICTQSTQLTINTKTMQFQNPKPLDTNYSLTMLREQVVRNCDFGVLERLREEAALRMWLQIQQLGDFRARRHCDKLLNEQQVKHNSLAKCYRSCIDVSIWWCFPRNFPFEVGGMHSNCYVWELKQARAEEGDK